ncbi:MAG: sterol desaturase family protein [Flavobacteriaceae bacterium]
MSSLKVTTENNKGQATIFKNHFLESLTKTNVTNNVIVYGIAIAALIYVALFIKNIPFLTFLAIFVFAILSWTLAEYLLHRYLFHWINENKFVQRFHFIMHGSHHLYPRDKERLLMPPVPGLIMATILFLLFFGLFSIFNLSAYTWAYFPGFFLGYLLYSFVHRATHVHKPPKRFKHLWKHHSLHHYKYPDKAFGVSTTFWDKIFGTMPPQ